MIYTADHLLDAHKIKNEASTLRHKFHQQHFGILIGALILTGIIDFILLFFLRTQVIYAGIFLICLVTVYLLLNRWLSYVKEIAVGLLYCGGVMLPALSLRAFELNAMHVVVMICFFFTALINIMMFSWFDHNSDVRDGYNSFSVKFGKAFTRKFLIALFILQVILLLFLFFHRNFVVLIMLASMNSVLCLIFVRSEKFNKTERYRLAGDLVFLIPTFFIVI
jgi:4-hydroxybenzoate polyprenyltransferase